MARDRQGQSGESAGRTAADREAARQERERRRAARDGGDGGAAPSQTPAPDPAPDPAPEREPAPMSDAGLPPALDPTPAPVADAGLPPALDPTPAPVADAGLPPALDSTPAPVADAGRVPEPDSEIASAPAPEGEPGPEARQTPAVTARELRAPPAPREGAGRIRRRRSVAIGAARTVTSRSDLLAGVGARRGSTEGEEWDGDPEQTGESGVHEDPSEEPPSDGFSSEGYPLRGLRRREGGRTRHSLRARIGAIASLIVVGVLVWLLVSLFQPFQGPGYGKVVVDIPHGTSGGEVGQILERDGVVASGFFFEVRAFLDGKRGELHAGRFILKHEMSYSAALAALTSGSAQIAVSKVIIPEGLTRPQIAAIARKDHLQGNYMKASRRVSGFDPRFYGAPAGTPSLEGFLFPATYEVESHGSVQALVSDQLEAFHERFANSFIKRAHALGLTPYKLLIVASMVEREAKLPHDRPLVAAVIYNRLHRGMTLGIDATIRFALHDYSGQLSEAQLHTRSPYNTRMHKGLPPTPISNPGMESIEAAAKPAHVGYLYYVDGADGCGDLVFSNTEAEFEADTARYNEALNANGGHLPACRHSK